MVVKFIVCRSICLVVLEIDRELDCLNIRNVKGFGFVWGGMGCKQDFRILECYYKNLRDIYCQVNLLVKVVCLQYMILKDLFYY